MEQRLIINVVDDLESTSPVDALSANMGRVLNEGKQDKIIDSGWQDLSLSNGAVAYSSDQKPQYRKIGSVVYLRGVFKGIANVPVAIATLPEGYRPSMKAIYMQSGTGNRVNRIEIGTNGVINYASATEAPLENSWHSLAFSFLVD